MQDVLDQPWWFPSATSGLPDLRTVQDRKRGDSKARCHRPGRTSWTEQWLRGFVEEDRAREKIMGRRARERAPFGLFVADGDGQNISEKENKGVREFLCP